MHRIRARFLSPPAPLPTLREAGKGVGIACPSPGIGRAPYSGPRPRAREIPRSLLVGALAVFFAWFAPASSALACAVCWGAADSTAVQAANTGVLVLLGVIGAVLVWVAAMIVFFVRRARNSTPPSITA